MHPLTKMMEKDQWWQGFKRGIVFGMCIAFILVGIT